MINEQSRHYTTYFIIIMQQTYKSDVSVVNLIIKITINCMLYEELMRIALCSNFEYASWSFAIFSASLNKFASQPRNASIEIFGFTSNVTTQFKMSSILSYHGFWFWLFDVVMSQAGNCNFDLPLIAYAPIPSNNRFGSTKPMLTITNWVLFIGLNSVKIVFNSFNRFRINCR